MASLVNVAKASSVDPPVLAVFSTGVPTVVSTSDSFSFQYFSNPRKPNEGVVFGESAQTHYLGTNTATAALTKNRNNYAVGVYRAGRDSVRIVPAHGLFVMKEANNADAAGLDLTTIAGSDYATVRTQLTERFGSRKRRRELRSEQANAFDVNANKSAALAAQMAFESAATLVPATDGNAGMHAARLEKLPAFNADAETPEGIYAFSALLPESAWSALDHKAVLAPEESAEELRAIYPRFVLIHLKRAQEMARVDRDAAKTLARQLVHLTYLLRLIRSRQGSQLRDLEDYTLAPHAVCTHIGRTYFEGRKLTDGARAKLSCHIAVLSLLCSPLLSIDAAGLEALAQDQQTTVLKLLPFFAEVGCKNASRTRAALTAPLQLPDVPTGGFRAR
jgi:hypothetical protein